MRARSRTPDGRPVTVAGIVLVRQRPGSAKGVTFITVEDETGIANLVVWQDVFARYRRVILGAGMLACRGRVQREGIVIHVVADRLDDLSGLLRGLAEQDLEVTHGRGDQVTHPGGPDPRETEAVRESRCRHAISGEGLRMLCWRMICARVAAPAPLPRASGDRRAEATPPPTPLNDYPTDARAEYVFACMATNGGTRDALERCSCSIDIIATLLPYPTTRKPRRSCGCGATRAAISPTRSAPQGPTR